MSGTGKSTVVKLLAAKGYRAVDTDDGLVDVLPDGSQLWREADIQSLLSEEVPTVLFIAGCEENMVQFLPDFDQVILLSAPKEVLVHRLATRTTNPFGKEPDDLRRILHDLDAVEPLLRKVADHEIVTTCEPDEVVSRILRLVGD